MRPTLAAAVLAAVIAAVAALAGHARRPSPRRAATEGPSRPLAASLCPPGSLPDDNVCIPVPAPGGTRGAAPAERIARRPDRDPSYARYALPVARALSVAELEPGMSGDGGTLPSGIALDVEPGADVAALRLEGQDGPTRVVYAGSVRGRTVVTLHAVHASGLTNEYLVAIGRLGTARELAPGAELDQGASLGTAGASAVTLETRLVRPGVDVRTLAPGALLDATNSVPTDPRNVLSLR